MSCAISVWGLEPDAPGPCFLRRLGRCNGACEAAEDVTRYNLRMQIAFHWLRLKTWPWPGPVAVIEHDARTDRTDCLVIYNWVHVATVHSEAELAQLDLRGRTVSFDLDSYRLILKELMGRRGPPPAYCRTAGPGGAGDRSAGRAGVAPGTAEGRACYS